MIKHSANIWIVQSDNLKKNYEEMRTEVAESSRVRRIAYPNLIAGMPIGLDMDCWAEGV